MRRRETPGCVVLKDGRIFSGFSFGVEGRVLGEIVFNTCMSGYQEVVSDPSYHGQMVVFTYPLIGNYGVSEIFLESDRVHSRAVVVREPKNAPRTWVGGDGWIDWLMAQGIVGVGGIDTRALTRHIRERGATTACVAAGEGLDTEELLEAARGHPDLQGRDLVRKVTCAAPYEWPAEPGPHKRRRVVAYDFGIKRSILSCLVAAGSEVTVVPAHWTAEQVLSLEPEGVFLSNGPGDPAAVTYAVESIRGILGKVPVLGICLGHQLLALALGLRTYKLKFGHRGANHPVRNYLTGRVEITSQNHGFAVEPPAVVKSALERGAIIGEGGVSSLEAKDMMLDTEFGTAQVTHLNLNDGTVEGLRLLTVPAFSVQYHPEAGPGPHDSRYLFARFVDLMSQGAEAII